MGSRLLARVLKEGVQFWYNDTSTVKGGGGGGWENVPLENLWSLRHFMSVSCPKLVRNFHTHFGFVNLCRYASLLNYDIFIQPWSGTPSNWSKCQMYYNNENWSYFVSYIVIYLGKSLKIMSLSPQNLGVQRRPLFVLGASLDALLAKSLMGTSMKTSSSTIAVLLRVTKATIDCLPLTAF
jgi:hypothetical protein